MHVHYYLIYRSKIYWYMAIPIMTGRPSQSWANHLHWDFKCLSKHDFSGLSHQEKY